MHSPLCFVLIPSAEKPDANGSLIDFDAIYREVIAPAINDAGMTPLRSDEGTTEKVTFESFQLCEYAVADLATADSNVFYELGVRHALRPGTTILLFPGKARLAFDTAGQRQITYSVNDSGHPEDIPAIRKQLTQHLKTSVAARGKEHLIFELLEEFPGIQRLKTDVFREQVNYAADIKIKFEEARSKGIDAVRSIEKELGDLNGHESAVIVDLLLSYRAVKGWPEMVTLVEKMPLPLKETVLVQEQFAFALNRMSRSDRAESILLDVIQKTRPNSETCSLLGRVYKDLWEFALKKGDQSLASRLLDKAISAYRQGFEADWRDAFPGINAVTLMELREPPHPDRKDLILVVTYAVRRRVASGKPDYWDYATLLELAILAEDQQAAESALSNAVAAVRESWEPETTARNLRLIREARERRGTTVKWAEAVEKTLAAAKPVS